MAHGSRTHASHSLTSSLRGFNAAEPVVHGGMSAEERKPVGFGNRLLIVDDELGITHAIKATARDLGFEVMSINDTDQFEKALSSLKPTIILLDIGMSGRDGLELIGHLATRNYSGRMVVMSGNDERYIQMSAAIAKSLGLWVTSTLTRPFRKQQVLDLLVDVAPMRRD